MSLALACSDTVGLNAYFLMATLLALSLWPEYSRPDPTLVSWSSFLRVSEPLGSPSHLFPRHPRGQAYVSNMSSIEQSINGAEEPTVDFFPSISHQMRNRALLRSNPKITTLPITTHWTGEPPILL